MSAAFEKLVTAQAPALRGDMGRQSAFPRPQPHTIDLGPMITKNITITATVAAALTLGHCWRRSHRDDRDDEPASSVYYSGGGGSGSSSHGTSGSESSSSVTRGGFGRSGWGFGGGS